MSLANSFYLDLIVPVNCLDAIKNLCKVDYQDDSLDEIDTIKLALLQSQAKKYIRGKYDTQFLLKFIRKMLESMQVCAKIYDTKANVICEFQISAKNIVQLLSPKTFTPPSLLAYMRQRIAS